ncbi:MAG: DASS family sodium-coupled anion symporter [Cyclobacteriaceae bacterium]
MKNGKTLGLLGGIAVLALMMILPPPEGMQPEAMRAAGVALLMTIWWVSEAIPIAATAFVPLALYPLLGILDAGTTTENYGHNYVLMLLGGFIIAKAIEIHQLHRRIALGIMKVIGTSRRYIILSFMVATALLSMWIANVAVTLLMLPIGLAIITRENESGEMTNFGLALMLAIAYAASIGGTGTLIGTPPNMAFVGIYQKLYPTAPEISFFKWMQLGIPLVIIFLPIIWIYINKYFKIEGDFEGGKEVVESEWAKLGPMTSAEKRVLALFIFTALGWIFRRDFVFDESVIPGWSSLIGVGEYAHDSTVALFACVLLFIIPTGDKKSEHKRLMNWKDAESVPWGVVIIVGGGYAIADGFAHTGLADWLGQQMAFIGSLPVLAIILIIVLLMIFLTEINSNTATANIFLPVLAVMAVSGGINPLMLMVPATFAASFAFMLPSGTGTNAVIFGSGKVTIPQMAKCGFWLNLISVVLLTLIMYTIAEPIFDLSLTVPDWAK